MVRTSRRIRHIHWLVPAIFLLTLADAACTVAGVRLGVISEGNPIIRAAMHAYPVWAGAAACAYTGALLSLVYRYGPRARCTVPLLVGLFAVKTAVMGLHLGWITGL